MKISFIYYLYNNLSTLKASIESLINQTNENFEIIFVDDFAEEPVKQIFNSFDLSHKKYRIIRLFENHGKSFSYNLGFEKVTGDYIYYADASNVFSPTFVDDILKIVNKKSFDYVSFKTDLDYLNDDFKQDLEISNTDNLSAWITNCSITFRNKLFATKFLTSNKIIFEKYNNFYPVCLFNIFINSKSGYFFAKQLINFRDNFNNNRSFTYNLYNILNSALMISYKINELLVDDAVKSNYLVWLPKLCLKDFLTKMFHSYFGNEKILTIAIEKAWEILEKTDLNFKNNASLLLLNDKNLVNYFLDFKPSYKYVRKNIKFN
ncbi:MAG: glycosyltransferase family 2 protein [Malacoplasma sp.]|nr:glycosyltransferase family 2 protein [Malacoplasma sp.]